MILTEKAPQVIVDEVLAKLATLLE